MIMMYIIASFQGAKRNIRDECFQKLLSYLCRFRLFVDHLHMQMKGPVAPVGMLTIPLETRLHPLWSVIFWSCIHSQQIDIWRLVPCGRFVHIYMHIWYIYIYIYDLCNSNEMRYSWKCGSKWYMQPLNVLEIYINISKTNLPEPCFITIPLLTPIQWKIRFIWSCF